MANGILAFPLEIQSKIFTTVHRDNPRNEALRLPEEVVLSHVCSLWRDISVNLPTLWTTFRFDSHLSAYPPLEKLDKYLHRSGIQLLELYFNISSSDYFDGEIDDYEGFSDALNLVETTTAHAHRWRRFTFFTDQNPEIDEVLDKICEIYAPNLEYFAMCPTSIDELPQVNGRCIDPTVLIGGAPKLSVARIDTTSHLLWLPPLSNISTLTIQQSPAMQDFSFQIFRSILMIPTLENLSIESAINLDTVSMGDRESLCILSPALKTLRIMQNHGILGILSFLDAPFIETVVLRNLDLASVYINQDVHRISSFKNLNTISLLDCRCEPRDADPEGVSSDVIAMILDKLFHRATHIIFSTIYDTASEIESVTQLLNFNCFTWPRLQHITLDLPTLSDPKSYERNLKLSPHSITLRVVQPLLQHWKTRQPNDLKRLENVCKLETMMVGDLIMSDPWPVSGGKFREDEGFIPHINWGERLRARGPSSILVSQLSRLLEH